MCALTIKSLSDSERKTLGYLQNTTNTSLYAIRQNVYWLIGLGSLVWLCGWIQTSFLMSTALRQDI